MQNAQVKFNVGGGGYWSNTKTQVRITELKLAYVNDERDFGELRVYFNTDDWDINALGLIYTDKQFMKELREYCNAQGFAGADVSYSEQGMQGRNFVSCDVGADFMRSWDAKFVTA